MSNANVSLVQSLYAAFGRGEVAALVDAAAPDCDWVTVGRPADFPTFGPHRGKAGVQSFFDKVAQHLDFSEFAPQEFHAVGDKVLVLGRYAMTVKRTGKPAATEWCHVFTISDGKVAKFREFTDTAQAAEAYRG